MKSLKTKVKVKALLCLPPHKPVLAPHQKQVNAKEKVKVLK